MKSKNNFWAHPIILATLSASLLSPFTQPLASDQETHSEISTPLTIQEDQSAFDQNQALNLSFITMQADMEFAFVLIQERLNLIHELARASWNAQKSPVLPDNCAMSVQISDDSTPHPFLKSFVESQNQAALLVLQKDFVNFEKQNLDSFESVLDLEKEIAPRLKEIDGQLINKAEEIFSHIEKESLPHFLKDISFYSFKNLGIDREIYDTAVESLFQNVY